MWLHCHVADYDQPWYEETDEETCRPREAGTPLDPSEGTLLVAAKFTLNQGMELDGFLTLAFRPHDTGQEILCETQPNVFLPTGRRENFWDGVFSRPAERRQAFYTELGLGPSQVFPITYSVAQGLVDREVTGNIQGFYSADPESGRLLRIDR